MLYRKTKNIIQASTVQVIKNKNENLDNNSNHKLIHGQCTSKYNLHHTHTHILSSFIILLLSVYNCGTLCITLYIHYT